MFSSALTAIAKNSDALETNLSLEVDAWVPTVTHDQRASNRPHHYQHYSDLQRLHTLQGRVTLFLLVNCVPICVNDIYILSFLQTPVVWGTRQHLRG